MTLTASSPAERAAYADAVRRCLDRHAGVRTSLADAGPARVDGALWEVLSDQLGLPALVIPELLGGAGGRWADLAVAVEALGARLAPVPALASVGMGTGVLLAAEGAGVAAELLGRIATGSPICTVVWPEAGAGGPAAPRVRARSAGGGLRLTGSASFVLHGVEAELLVVPALLGDAVVLAAVDGETPGLLRRSMTTLDLTRGMAEVALDDAAAALVLDGEDANSAIELGFDLSLTMLAVESVGVAQTCLDAAVSHVKERVQFDRPIGSFQAVKHRLVDLLLALELARSAAEAAVRAADEHLAEPGPHPARALRAAASMAKAMCGESATLIARESLHLYGGIGFTWEHDAHLYYRRAVANELLLGDPAAHRVRLAAALGV